VHDRRSSFDVVFEMRHEMSAVTFDLLIGGDGAEHDLSEPSSFERSVRDPSNYLERLLDNGYGQMGSVVDKASYVVFGHLGELLLEDAFEARENDETFALVVIVDDSEFDLSVSLLNHCWLQEVNTLIQNLLG